MISYGKRRRPLTNLREWGRMKKISRERSTQQADKEDIENATADKEDIGNSNKEDIGDVANENVEDIGSEPAWAPDSPIYVPPATFSSPDISVDDSVNHMKVTTHATMEAKTIDALNANDATMICSERDKMKLGGVLKNHPLLFRFNRALWPTLFATCQLKASVDMSRIVN